MLDNSRSPPLLPWPCQDQYLPSFGVNGRHEPIPPSSYLQDLLGQDDVLASRHLFGSWGAESTTPSLSRLLVDGGASATNDSANISGHSPAMTRGHATRNFGICEGRRIKEARGPEERKMDLRHCRRPLEQHSSFAAPRVCGNLTKWLDCFILRLPPSSPCCAVSAAMLLPPRVVRPPARPPLLPP
jgi:hypothetical protein